MFDMRGVATVRVENVLRRMNAGNARGVRRAERDQSTVQYVPSAPLVMAMLASGRRLKDVAVDSGLSERLFLSWRTGERRQATWTAADAVLVAVDRFWWEVFDPEDGQAGAFSGVRGRDVVAWVAAAEAAVLLWEPDEAEPDEVPVRELAGVGARS